MTTSTKSICRVPRKPLAACCAVIFALAAPEAFAATWTVTSCADHGSGSLRDIIASPSTASGDTVDLSQLGTCGSSISLKTGAIVITQQSLFLQGPAGSHATVTGYYYGTRSTESDRVLTHLGTGTLNLSNLYVSDGNLTSASTPASGGCIYSKGHVYLNHATVYGCKAQGNYAYGGGISANQVSAKYSQILGNKVTGTMNSHGGGVDAGAFNATNSTISGNSARSGGGINAFGTVSIVNSTVSNNIADYNAGLRVQGGITQTLTISNSTISGNIANLTVGGVNSGIPTTVQNSTIAFNSASSGKTGNGYYASGLAVFAFGTSQYAVKLQSSIISNNTYGSTELDFSTQPRDTSSFMLSGSGNLIRVAKGPQTPITTTACPLLGPLRNNGGLTFTHALMSHSPAIDGGNNAANLKEDQRGAPLDTTPFPYPRVWGAGADIGAYEVQQADIIFNSSFEGCPVLF